MTYWFRPETASEAAARNNDPSHVGFIPIGEHAADMLETFGFSHLVKPHRDHRAVLRVVAEDITTEQLVDALAGVDEDAFWGEAHYDAACVLLETIGEFESEAYARQDA